MMSYFVKTLFQQEYLYQEMDKLNNYIKANIGQIIKCYFGGHVKKMRDILGDNDDLYHQIIT